MVWYVGNMEDPDIDKAFEDPEKFRNWRIRSRRKRFSAYEKRLAEACESRFPELKAYIDSGDLDVSDEILTKDGSKYQEEAFMKALKSSETYEDFLLAVREILKRMPEEYIDHDILL
jgi:hypothetical protein